MFCVFSEVSINGAKLGILLVFGKLALLELLQIGDCTKSKPLAMTGAYFYKMKLTALLLFIRDKAS